MLSAIAFSTQFVECCVVECTPVAAATSRRFWFKSSPLRIVWHWITPFSASEQMSRNPASFDIVRLPPPWFE
jgi:hypothetical protein